jgi:hypothetical protein
MSIRNEYEVYRTPEGIFSNVPGGRSGNDPLFTAEALISLRATDEWTKADDALIDAEIDIACRIEKGLYGRGPGYMQDQISVDDHVGLGIISARVAKDIRSYGWHHFWYFKTGENVAFWAPFLGRFPALWAHLAWCAGEKPNWFLRLGWAYSVAFGGKPGDQDSWILNSLLVHVAGNKGWLERLATRRYLKGLKSSWGTIKACYAAYFGNPNHPTAKYYPEPKAV